MNADKPRILLIDDDQECLKVISTSLTLFGYPSEKFSNPREAVEALRSEKFDIVVTDYKMPEMTGIEVLKAIRWHHPDTYVIIMTGFADTDNAVDAVNFGAHSFFCKPLDIKCLLGKIFEIERELKDIEHKENGLIQLYREFSEIEKKLKKST